MLKLGLGKYRTMVVAIALFLLFDLAVLLMNTFISSEISKDATNVNIIGRQRVLTQTMAKAALQIENRMNTGQAYQDLMLELDQALAIFDQTLKAYLKGGIVPSGKANSTIEIEAVGDEEARKMLTDAMEQWEPFRDAVVPFVRSPKPTLEEASDIATRAEIINLWLLSLTENLTSRIEALAASKASTLRKVQLAGMLLATMNFFFITFYFIRHLRRNDEAIEEAHQETKDILRTTQEGLFLLDPSGRIGTQQSSSLSEILGVPIPAGTEFMALIRPLVTPKVFETAREYIDLLLRHDVKEKLVTSLNPLECVEISTGQSTGTMETRFLRFRFNRVMKEGKVTHLLVTTNDISRNVRLERELRNSEERAQGQMGVLLQILGIEPHLLQDFMHTAGEGLDMINHQLETQPAKGENLLSKLNAIYRITHRIKGDAAAGGLESIVRALHELEDMLDVMRERGHLTGEDFLPVAVRMKTLYGEMDAINNAVARMAQIRGVVTVEPARPQTLPEAKESAMIRQWQGFAEQIALKQGKQIEIAYQGMNVEALHPVQREAISSIVNQFIRNALIHGIEKPDQRQAKGKAATGRLAIYVADFGSNGIELSFRDDGQGMDPAKLRAAVIRAGRMSEEEAAGADMRRLVSFIFEPGISTRETVDEDAGRGEGLDAVRDLVRKLGGQIRIGTTTGEYCHFRVQLPPVRESVVSLPALSQQESAA